MYEYSHMGGFGIGMGLFWILIFAAIIWLAASMANRTQKSEPKTDEVTPLELLKKRYALGEIDDEEYQLRKKRLEGK